MNTRTAGYDFVEYDLNKNHFLGHNRLNAIQKYKLFSI